MCLLNFSFFRATSYRNAALTLVISIASLGCGGGGGGPSSGRLAVSGDVLLDGQPLDQGAIQFEPAAGTSKLNAGGVITNGKYVIAAAQGLPPGKYTVRITSFPKDTRSAEEIMNKPGPPPKERIAAKFNTESTEVVEVIGGKKNNFNFKVESATE